jgi:putative oxidoreductase
MNLNKNILLKYLRDAIVLMWCYAAGSKLIQYEESRGEMLNQVFPLAISEVLVWAVPVTELIIAVMLLKPAKLRPALWASLILLSLFTLYISVVMTGVFGRIPCSCGGILEKMSWGQHLIFNLFFIALTLVAIFFQPQTSHAKKFDLKTEPDNLSPAGDKTSMEIQPGNGKNYNEKLPRIRAPAEEDSITSNSGEAAP